MDLIPKKLLLGKNGGEQPGRFRAREDDSGRLFINRGTTANDQNTPLARGALNGSFCQNLSLAQHKAVCQQRTGSDFRSSEMPYACVGG